MEYLLFVSVHGEITIREKGGNINATFSKVVINGTVINCHDDKGELLLSRDIREGVAWK